MFKIFVAWPIYLSLRHFEHCFKLSRSVCQCPTVGDSNSCIINVMASYKVCVCVCACAQEERGAAGAADGDAAALNAATGPRVTKRREFFI